MSARALLVLPYTDSLSFCLQMPISTVRSSIAGQASQSTDMDSMQTSDKR
jgi:hypothetical protein